MKKSDQAPSPLFYILIILAMIFWAAAWTSGKVASSHMDGEVIVFYRLLLSFLGMLPVIFIMGLSIKISFKDALWLLGAAALFIGYNQFFFLGLKEGLAGAGGVLVTTVNPVITFGLTLLFYRIKLSARALFGLVIGVAGGAILLQVWTLDLNTLLQAGNAYFILASLTWSLLTLLSQKIQQKIHFIVYSCYLYGLGTLFSIPFAIPKGLDTIFNQKSFVYYNLIFLSLLAMAFASTVFFLASKKIGSHRASSFIFIVPVLAPAISYFVLHEMPQWHTVIGGCTALTAVYLINSNKKQQQEKPIKKLSC